MQELPPEGKWAWAIAPVKVVSDQRMPEGLQMGANLMRDSRADIDFEQGKSL